MATVWRSAGDTLPLPPLITVQITETRKGGLRNLASAPVVHLCYGDIISRVGANEGVGHPVGVGVAGHALSLLSVLRAVSMHAALQLWHRSQVPSWP